MHGIVIVRTTAVVMLIVVGTLIALCRSTGELRNCVVAAMVGHVMRWGDQQHGLQIQGFTRAGYADGIGEVGIVHFT